MRRKPTAPLTRRVASLAGLALVARYVWDWLHNIKDVWGSYPPLNGEAWLYLVQLVALDVLQVGGVWVLFRGLTVGGGRWGWRWWVGWIGPAIMVWVITIEITIARHLLTADGFDPAAWRNTLMALAVIAPLWVLSAPREPARGAPGMEP